MPDRLQIRGTPQADPPARVRRRAPRWAALPLAVTCTAGLALGYLGLRTPVYTASASIVLDPSLRLGSFPDLDGADAGLRTTVSDAVLRRVIATERLDRDREFSGAGQPWMARVSQWLAGVSPPTASPGREAAALAQAIETRPSERGSAMELGVSSADPVKAAHLANAIAAAYLAYVQEIREGDLSRRLADAAAQASKLQDGLRTAQDALESYKAQNKILEVNGAFADGRIAPLADALPRASARTAEARARWEQAQRAAKSGRLPDAADGAASSPELDRLRVQYADTLRKEAADRLTLGDLHPDFIEVETQLRETRRAIASELKRLAEAAARDYKAARGAEEEAARNVAAARGSQPPADAVLGRAADLARDVAVARAAYDRAVEARRGILDEPPQSSARVLAPAAIPREAAGPTPLAVMAGALAAGLALGGLATLLRKGGPTPTPAFPEDRAAVETTEDPQPSTGSAEEPAHSATDLDDAAPALAGAALLLSFRGRPAAPLADATRALCDDLALREESGTPAVVLVTRGERGIDSFAVAIDLARTATEHGRHVLVIAANEDDAALPSQLASGLQPGLIDCAGQLRLIYHVGAADDDELYLMSLGDDEPDAVRALLATGLQPIERFGSHFDFVVIDGPPVEPVGPGRLLAETADEIILLARPGTGQVEGVADTLDRMDVPGWTLHGKILSTADLDVAA